MTPFRSSRPLFSRPEGATRWLSLLGIVAAVALVASACGSSAAEDADATAPLASDATADAGTESGAASAMSGHAHEPIDASGWDPQPSLTFTVTEDAMSGWNVHFTYDGFTLAPEHASGAPIDGEGHLHLYVDGTKVARVYGDWFHLDGISVGQHEVRAELTANNHATLTVHGEPVAAVTTIEETRDNSATAAGGHNTEDDHHDMEMTGTTASTDTSMADVEFAVLVKDGKVEGDTGRQEISVGDVVAIVVSADVTDQVHVHGYDLVASVAPDEDAIIVFAADVPGVFEVELEGAGLPLTELLVR